MDPSISVVMRTLAALVLGFVAGALAVAEAAPHVHPDRMKEYEAMRERMKKAAPSGGDALPFDDWDRRLIRDLAIYDGLVR